MPPHEALTIRPPDATISTAVSTASATTDIATNYQSATRKLLRESVFNAMHDLLLRRDWSKITMADVAASAGLSRQTLYSAFGNRQGLAQSYALLLAESFAGAITSAIEGHPGDIRAALKEGIANFLAQSAADPLVNAFTSGTPKPDLLRLITTESGPILEQAISALSPAFTDTWLGIDLVNAEAASAIIARVGISFISLPPSNPALLAGQLADMVVPFLQQVSTERT